MSTKRPLTNDFPPHPDDPALTRVRVYPEDGYGHADGEGDTTADESDPADESMDIVETLIAWRKTERDLAQIASDPSQLPGYHELPASVQALATVDPMRFWMLWQLSQAGVDLRELDDLRAQLQQQLDIALHAAGWDGTSAPTDELFARAGETLRQIMQ
jgi:hypothetical protein